MVRRVIVLGSVLVALLHADMFEQGKKNFGLSLGAGSSFGQTYTVAGVNANYFVLDNLAVGARYRGWFGATPTQHEVAVESNYYLPLRKKIHPYIGAFARETFVSSDYIDNFQTYGARGGVAISMAKNTFLSVGYAIEYYADCQLDECTTSYPELVFGVAF